MAISLYYTDFLNGSNTTGNGTSATPWKTVQKALNTITRNAIDGDQINVRDTAADVLTAALSFATYGTPTIAAPIIIRGYTNTHNDGGRGTISGGGTVAVSAFTGICHWIDMRLTNCGSATVLIPGTNSAIVRCELDTTKGTVLNTATNGNIMVVGCYIHDWATSGTATRFGVDLGLGLFYGNYLKSTAINNTASNAAVRISGTAGAIINCIIDVRSGHGITIAASDMCSVLNCSIYGGGSAQNGINFASGAQNENVINCIIEGFSGAGGKGVAFADDEMVYVGNAFHNNTTHESLGDVHANLGNNDVLGASAFVNAGSGDFDINSTVTGVTEDAWPQSWPGLITNTRPKPDKGAVQAGAGSAGSSIYRRVARVIGQ